jgi:hypothetical protein
VIDGRDPSQLSDAELSSEIRALTSEIGVIAARLKSLEAERKRRGAGSILTDLIERRRKPTELTTPIPMGRRL